MFIPLSPDKADKKRRNDDTAKYCNGGDNANHCTSA